MTAEGASKAYEVTAEGAHKVYEVSAAGGAVVMNKLDEVGVTDGVKAAGGYVYEKGSDGLSFVNSKIEENETLSGLKK